MHPTDTALRDLSALCIEEFLRWSIKQTSEKQLAKSPINIKSLLKRLYSLATHPSANKRLGAALAFNNIYRVFRWVFFFYHTHSQKRATCSKSAAGLLPSSRQADTRMRSHRLLRLDDRDLTIYRTTTRRQRLKTKSKLKRNE